ncbi:hypothetical protein [Streptomyces sp. NPDC006551]|uniref:nitroreductase family protein n=1 Tax=Streptomyces sp. NPDC006551 TaxID=3157178 RepID=UPI0033B85CAC
MTRMDAAYEERGGPAVVRDALALARSAREPGPDFPAGPAVTAWPGEAVPVPAELDALLRKSLAGGRLRPAASAGALHPVNTHLLAGPGSPLPTGRYAYDPVAHRLHPRGRVPDDAPPGLLAVLTVTARRTVSHYGHRAWPLLLLDTGHTLAALALAGAEAICVDADGIRLAAAAGLTPERGEPEHAVAAVWCGPGTRPAPDALTRWASYGPGTAPLGGDRSAPAVLRAARAVLEEVTSGAREGSWTPCSVPRADLLGARRPVPGRGLGSGAGRAAGPVPERRRGEADVVVRRSAAPGFTGPPDPAVLARLLTAAERTAAQLAGADAVRWCVATGGPDAAVLGGSGAPEPRPIALGDARATLARWAAGQTWLAGAGAVLLAHGCPDDAPPAEVRRAHLSAGYAVAIAQVLAGRAGLESRPVGSWQGADLGAALGEPPGRYPVVHGLALGTHPAPAPAVLARATVAVPGPASAPAPGRASAREPASAPDGAPAPVRAPTPGTAAAPSPPPCPATPIPAEGDPRS